MGLDAILKRTLGPMATFGHSNLYKPLRLSNAE